MSRKRRLAWEAKLQQLEMEGKRVHVYDDEYEVIGREGELYLAVPSTFVAVIYVLIVLVLLVYYNFVLFCFVVVLNPYQFKENNIWKKGQLEV